MKSPSRYSFFLSSLNSEHLWHQTLFDSAFGIGPTRDSLPLCVLISGHGRYMLPRIKHNLTPTGDDARWRYSEIMLWPENSLSCSSGLPYLHSRACVAWISFNCGGLSRVLERLDRSAKQAYRNRTCIHHQALRRHGMELSGLDYYFYDWKKKCFDEIQIVPTDENWMYGKL